MSSLPTDISVSLSVNMDTLWKSCFELNNEMIITADGRRVFPTLEYDIKGLDPLKYYSMYMHFDFIDDVKYRFINGNWTKSPSTEEKGVLRRVVHHHGLQLGQNWMDRPLSFDQIRITNRKSNEQTKGPSFVHLYTQHRYIPVLTIYERDQVVHVSKIDYTGFITVTSYHSAALNEFKTNSNPYATGSRQHRRQKRSLASGETESSSSSSSKKMKKEPASPTPSTSDSSVPPIPSPTGAFPFPFMPMFPTGLFQPDLFLQQVQLFSQMTQPMLINPFLPLTLFPTPPISPPITPESPSQIVTSQVNSEPAEPLKNDVTIDV
ncbi:hypothetical protein CRE_08573 [Caenorhabditis remanei]|uniref:T-box domain-containing protein n=1 Tax=Caenorhabditis remanei TaxID=31234 RepID=E3NH09_CAERE|nr:hypothetical protein CRE_08573 [Caenorhabditis remanei]